MDSRGAVLILISGIHAVACYPAFKLVELNLYAPYLGLTWGCLAAADRLAVTDAPTKITRSLKFFLCLILLRIIYSLLK